jgi:hypothetical protein
MMFFLGVVVGIAIYALWLAARPKKVEPAPSTFNAIGVGGGDSMQEAHDCFLKGYSDGKLYEIPTTKD